MSATKVHRVDWRADNFLVGTSMLGPNEGWLYTVIINLIYSHGEAIDADIAWLSHITHMHGNAVRAALRRLAELGKVWESDGKLMAKRCGNELETARKRMRSALENGGKGGRPSNKNSSIEKPNGLRDSKATNTNTNTSDSTDTDVSSESQKKRALSRDALFAAWWAIYPHKVGKGAAQAKFDIAMRNGVDLDALVAGVERYKRTKPPDHPWLNPATWVYQRRWLDEPATSLSVVSDDAASTEPQPELTDEEKFRARLGWSQKHDERWIAEWGPPPTDPDCEAPYGLLVEFGYRQKRGVKWIGS